MADQEGFVHVYDIKEYGLQEPELQPPKSRQYTLHAKYYDEHGLSFNVIFWLGRLNCTSEDEGWGRRSLKML